MPHALNEKAFEDSVEQTLLAHGYSRGNAEFDKALGLFPADLLDFIRQTQPKLWQRLADLYRDRAEKELLNSLQAELKSKGVLAVLRDGFKCVGKTFQAAFFKPNSGLNAQLAEQYAQNRICVYRQVTTQSGARPDVILAVNGLPVVVVELKNQTSATGWTAEINGKAQLCGRDFKTDPLFMFNQRALVHFAVDTETALMTTKLAGKDTYFLPFNRGNNGGAGNPPCEDSTRTQYLWETVLNKDSLLDIVARFVHLQKDEKTVHTERGLKTIKKETLIFPRFHQLDVVRKLTAHAKAHGSGHNYLIQHSAGSGKSNSIAWLAHRLSTLHNENNDKIFNSVIVITDRVVLDRQLQDTIYQFEHKAGVVQKIDENTQQLARALAGDTQIIITTIQKFPFITQAIDTLNNKGVAADFSTVGKRFAVIVDEAHSSQSGETAMELRKILNKDGIEAAIAEQLLDMEDEPLSEEAKKEMLREMQKRARQPNLSFFAFTATPKFKTLCLFDEKGDNGKAPFHHYSMRQAIEEGFILDVLKNYTTYARYYELNKIAEDDPELPGKKTMRALARFVAMHDYEIAQKVEVIVEHFRTFSRHKIGGRAKAMIVTGSREHAVRYKLGLDKYLKKQGYTDIKALVAFSGEVSLKEYDEPFTEVKMNGGIKETELPETFAQDDYKLLLVAEKYQTGFDQPLLHSMYVDKKLAGVQAVQTLSRLNRTCAGKEDTFVLDFANTKEEIYAAFKPYYEATSKGEDTDPQQLNNLAHALQESGVIVNSEVNEWCEIWFTLGKNTQPDARTHGKLNALLDLAANRFCRKSEEEQDVIKSQLQSFRRLYAFVSQIVPYNDSHWEKLYSYIRYLLPKLPSGTDPRQIEIDDDVALQYYRLQKISEGAINLKDGQAEALQGPGAVGTRQEDEEKKLSLLINKLNERFGTEFTPADQLFFDQIAETALENEQLKQAGKANSRHNFSQVFKQLFENMVAERMEGNEEIFSRLMNDGEFYDVAAEHLVDRVYPQLSSKEEL